MRRTGPPRIQFGQRSTNRRPFDAENKIRTVNGSSAYVYDGAGQRVRKLVGENLRFVYGIGGEQIAEFDGGTGALKKEYIYGANGLVATIEPTAINSNGTEYTTSDTLGSPRVITSSTAAVVGRHDYMPFGEEIGAGIGGRTSGMGFGVADGQRQKFTSKERDNETGLDYFGARYYGSTQGRFTSPDPLNVWALEEKQRQEYAANPQRWNKYSYALNNPLRYVDPTGLVDMPVWDDLNRKLQQDLRRHGISKKTWNNWSNDQRQGTINFRAKMMATGLWDKVGRVQFGFYKTDGNTTTWTVDRRDNNKNWQLGFTVKGNISNFRNALSESGIADDGTMHKHGEAAWSAHEGSGMSLHILGLKAPATQILNAHFDTGGGNWYNPLHWPDAIMGTGPSPDDITSALATDPKVQKNLRVGMQWTSW